MPRNTMLEAFPLAEGLETAGMDNLDNFLVILKIVILAGLSTRKFFLSELFLPGL